VTDLTNAVYVGEFVTAVPRRLDSPRQGWIVCLDPLVIEGQSGSRYECDYPCRIVDNPPERKWCNSQKI
jgi:hypothetical protein